MSFDLMVFDPARAPRLRAAFLDWFRDGTQIDGHDYSSPASLTPPLQHFYAQLRLQFPPRGGPDGSVLAVPPPGPVAEPGPPAAKSGLWRRLVAPPKLVQPPPAPQADYSFADAFIYLSFLRESADLAYQGVLATAHDCGVGFFNAASDWGEILHDPEQFGPYLGL